jgi:Protein of unknown function (DUF3606)
MVMTMVRIATAGAHQRVVVGTFQSQRICGSIAFPMARGDQFCYTVDHYAMDRARREQRQNDKAIALMNNGSVAAGTKGWNEMADDKMKHGVPDRIRINVDEPYELESWSKRLGVRTDELRRLVAKHGVMAADVRRALAIKR